MLEIELNDFNLEDLPQSSSSLSDEELNMITEQLKVKESVFDDANVNKATAREFISVILVNAVYFIQKNNDSMTKLMVKKLLVGSYGYEPLDYVIMIQKFFVLLVTEAKSHETRKGIAQNLVQLDSVYEVMCLF